MNCIWKKLDYNKVAILNKNKRFILNGKFGTCYERIAISGIIDKKKVVRLRKKIKNKTSHT